MAKVKSLGQALKIFPYPGSSWLRNNSKNVKQRQKAAGF